MSDIRRQAYAVLDGYDEGYAAALINVLEYRGVKTEDLAAEFKKLCLELGKSLGFIETWIEHFDL